MWQKISNNKLKNFPRVYYVSLEESTDRQINLKKQFDEYGVSINGVISKRFYESDDVVTGAYAHQLNDGTKGCAVSHLKAIKNWYETTNEDYVFLCEDDLSLKTVEYWDFTWEEFISNLPSDWDIIQLLTIRNDFVDFQIRERYWNDWGATAYIIKRDYAKKLIDTYIKEKSYHLEIPNSSVMPLVENILFATLGKIYTVPLFIEDITFNSTFRKDQDDDVNNGQKNNHYLASEIVLNYWKTKNKFTSMSNSEMEIEKLLEIYCLDTENPENNFNLGVWYENSGHTAPAVSYYLRCAEIASETDSLLAYEALIRGSYCYDKQGTRDNSARSLLWQAQVFLPNRPEAYFLLARFAEKRGWWQDCYSTAHLALTYCDFNQPSLRTDIEYPGHYGLIFEKAISAWWWGKHNECISLFTDILTSYENVKIEYIKSIHDNLNMMGIEIPISKSSNQLIQNNKFSLSETFDWSELTYEDIITIDREIIHEQVYRFWRDVKENDIVVDIGASVGPFVCSILPNKPRKVYCVEPSKTLLKSLAKNCVEYLMDYTDNPLVYTNHAIIDESIDEVNIFGHSRDFTGITFNEFIKNYNLQKVNFLKIDCEGGEYNVFKDENMDFLLHNVEFIAMETHLNYSGCREKFKNFRDKYLVQFDNFKVMSCTRQNISWGESLDIKDRIFDNEFIDNYTCEFMIYIYNKVEA